MGAIFSYFATMNRTVLSVVVLILWTMGCQSDMPTATKEPGAVPVSPITPASKSGDSQEYAARDVWQQPQLVIEKLGPLEGKTIADIGAGPYGYFALRLASREPIAKVIAIDIDPKSVAFMEAAKNSLQDSARARFTTRLVPEDDPMLAPGEADVVLIVNTILYFNNRVQYLKNLHKGLKAGGKLVIVDFEMRNTPVGPPLKERIPLGQIEQELMAAGYKNIQSDTRTLEYQYIITADN